jgi:hypothetical protein
MDAVKLREGRNMAEGKMLTQQVMEEGVLIFQVWDEEAGEWVSGTEAYTEFLSRLDPRIQRSLRIQMDLHPNLARKTPRQPVGDGWNDEGACSM